MKTARECNARETSSGRILLEKDGALQSIAEDRINFRVSNGDQAEINEIPSRVTKILRQMGAGWPRVQIDLR